ncbi:MAG TPA: MFS transporter [Longimicrobiales bacterium]|nr:MFS transporter [Longimicrobiales bacterium]
MPVLPLALYVAAGLRSAVIALTAIVLGLHLAQLELSPANIGLVVAVGMAANALTAAVVAGSGARLPKRPALVGLAVLSGLGLVALAYARSLPVIAAAAFVGLVNGMGRDRGGAQALEQVVLTSAVHDRRRTRAFVYYTVAQDAGAAFGSLLAGLGPALERRLAIGATPYATLLAVAGALTVLSAILYRAVPAIEHTRAVERPRVSPESRKRIAGLSSLFLLDSLGGGFLAGTLISYWFFERFALASGTIGIIFFVARVLNAASYFAADWLAERIGLIRTMVYTHLPSSAFLLVLPWVQSPACAIALFLLRESLVQMDVPARQSYITAVVAPHERAAALGITNLVRYAGWAVGPGIAGIAMTAVSVSAPLVFGAILKVIYDVALYGSYRRVRPPEEREAAHAGGS